MGNQLSLNPMKPLFTLLMILLFCRSEAQITETGHAEHFVAGMVIGAGTSYLVYRKTNNKLKSFLIGFGAATIAGAAKELIDPHIGRVQSGKDFGYTVLGGAVGASIVFPLKSRKTRNYAYLF